MSDTTTEAVERLAAGYAADARYAKAMEPYYKGPLRAQITADMFRALAAERDTLAARVAELEAENARLQRSRDRYREEWEHAKAHQEVAATRAISRAALQKDTDHG